MTIFGALRRRRRVLLQPSEGTSKIMNWIILIVAGLCECGFTFCLGKAKLATGWEAAGAKKMTKLVVEKS